MRWHVYFASAFFVVEKRVIGRVESLVSIKISTRDRPRQRRRPGGESRAGIQQILHCHLRYLWDRQFSLSAIRPGHDVADAGAYMLGSGVVAWAISLGLHWGQSRCVLERQMSDGWEVQVTVPKGPQSWRMRRGRQRGVVGRGRERVVREGWRGRRS
jgi:hypothetical protein